MNIKKKKRGFTIAELLTVMTIMAIIVLAATIPLIRPKTVKKDTSRIPHGIFECYWKDGKLYQYYADNKENKDAQPIEMIGDSCLFNAPKANYYRFQLVGAGGNGYVLPVYHNIETKEKSESTSIKEMANLPSIIKNNWVAPTLTVSMTSGTGQGGDAFCMVSQIINPGADRTCDGIATNSWGDCKGVITKHGGNSGKAVAFNTSFKIHYDDVIDWGECDTSSNCVQFSINHRKCQLLPSSSGQNATDSADYYGTFGTNGKAFGCSSFGNVSLTEKYSAGGDCSDEFVNSKGAGSPAQNPTITVQPENLTYLISYPDLTVTLGQNGQVGQVINFSYPKLNGTQLKITPAKTETTTTKIETQGMVLLEAKSGESAINTYDVNIGDVSHYGYHDSPLIYEPDNVSSASRPPMANINDTGLKSYIEENGLKPGKPGVGSYPYLAKISYPQRVKIGGTYREEGIKTINFDTNVKCKNGSNPEPSGNPSYCKGELGESGAVRIVW